MEISSPKTLFAGRVTRDFVIFPSGDNLIDIAGGNVLYAGAGYVVWEAEPPPGILARVGEDYPQNWIDYYSSQGLDMRGVKVLPEPMDVRSFMAFSSIRDYTRENPISHFAKHGLPFPKALLGYEYIEEPIDSRIDLKPFSLREEDIPAEFETAGAIHVCPVDFLTHSLFPALLRKSEFTTVTLDPSPGYMNPTFWNDVPSLLTGLTAFIPAEEEIRYLFQGRSEDIWEMAEALAAYNCELIVIKCGERGQLVYDAAGRTRWEVPSYPSKVKNPTGAGNAFCGGFMAGYRLTFDPLEAALFGNISASIAVEGYRPEYSFGVLPGLPQARLDAVRQSVRKV
ncbi:MAG: carbohydrate kinase family protein [Anaerolineales bacterium]